MSIMNINAWSNRGSLDRTMPSQTWKWSQLLTVKRIKKNWTKIGKIGGNMMKIEVWGPSRPGLLVIDIITWSWWAAGRRRSNRALFLFSATCVKRIIDKYLSNFAFLPFLLGSQFSGCGRFRETSFIITEYIYVSENLGCFI